MAGLLLIYRIIHSPFGQVLKAIRDNEPRAISLGFRANQYKLTVFVLSATLAGLAGATKAIVFQLASLTDVHWSMSGEVVLMTLVGGMGTVFGPIVGAFVIVAMENYLATLGAWVTVVPGRHLRRLRAAVPRRNRGPGRALDPATALTGGLAGLHQPAILRQLSAQWRQAATQSCMSPTSSQLRAQASQISAQARQVWRCWSVPMSIA